MMAAVIVVLVVVLVASVLALPAAGFCIFLAAAVFSTMCPACNSGSSVQIYATTKR